MSRTNAKDHCGVGVLLSLAVMFCGLAPAHSHDPPELAERPECPRACRITIEMNPPAVWYGEPYAMTFRYENIGEDAQEIFCPQKKLWRPYKLLVFDKNRRYVGDLLKGPRVLAVSGPMFPTTCGEWVRVPPGGVYEQGLSLPGREELPPSGRYFVQLSLSERFFTGCPFREALCRPGKDLEARPPTEADSGRAVHALIEARVREQWTAADDQKGAARSNVLEVAFNDRRRRPVAQSGDLVDKRSSSRKEGDSSSTDAGYTARLSTARELRPDSPADILVLLDRTKSQNAIYNPFFDRESELPGTLQLLDERGTVVADDLLGRAETLTETPDADLFLPAFRDRVGATFRLSIDREGRLSVRTNGVERDTVARLEPGRYRLVCIYYKRAFRLYHPDPCGLKDWEREAWKSTEPASVAFGSNLVELQVSRRAD